MAGRKNIYSGAEFNDIKEELNKALSELAVLPIENAIDEMEEKTSISGIKTPYIISSIEDKLKTAMVVIIDSAEQLRMIAQQEGLSTFVSNKVFILKSKLEQIQEYYKSRTYSDIQHRFVYEEKINKKGNPYQIKLEAATKEEQVKTRSKIQKDILKVLPILNQLESDKEEVQRKGGGDIPDSLKGLI